ncbi:MAG: hypothetical protein K2K37_00550 [Muribaculaceae bacterium]|nr:hypothetical protein [Muribaculaceae bacterium]
MKKFLRELLVSAVVGLSVPCVMAQSESFTGVSGKDYFVDYEAGLVMQLQDDEAILLSPVSVVETEFQPLLDYVYYLADEHDKTLEVFKLDTDTYEQVLNMWQLEWEDYEEIRQLFMDSSMSIFQCYMELLNTLDDIHNNRPASYKAASRAMSSPTTFTFGIQSLISSMDYAQFKVEFTRDWLKSFEESILDFYGELQETDVELDEILNEHIMTIERHLAYIDGVVAWIEESGIYADDETLYEVAEDIVSMSDDLKIDVEYFPSNPVEYLTSWAESSNDYMQKTLDAYNDAKEYIIEIGQECSTLIQNFSGVLFAGAYGEYFGLYPSLVDNDGILMLPNAVTVGEKEYAVTAVDGNIFSCAQPDVTLSGILLSLPTGVTKIQNEAFAIDGIVGVVVPTPVVPSLEDNCFTSAVYDNAQLVVLSGMENAFKADPVWKKFRSLESSGLGKNLPSNADIHLEGSTLIMDTDASVAVYTPDGRIVYAGNDKAFQLPAKGLYIVKAGSKTIKIKY